MTEQENPKKENSKQDLLAKVYHETAARKVTEFNRVKFMEGAFFGIAQQRLETYCDIYLDSTEEEKVEMMDRAKRYYFTAERLAKKYACVEFLQPHFNAYEVLKQLARGEVE